MEWLKKLPLNFELMGNPVNWVILWLMIVLGTAALALIIQPNNVIIGNDED